MSFLFKQSVQKLLLRQFAVKPEKKLILICSALMKEINIKQFSKFPQRSKQSGMDTALGEVAKDFMTYIIGRFDWFFLNF